MCEFAFASLVSRYGFSERFSKIESCGTSDYTGGSAADSRTIDVLVANGINGAENHCARQVKINDFDDFDYIFVMDSSNLSNLQKIQPKNSKAKVLLFGHFDGKTRSETIKDPYYGGESGFEENFNQIMRFTRNFLIEVLGWDGQDDS